MGSWFLPFAAVTASITPRCGARPIAVPLEVPFLLVVSFGAPGSVIVRWVGPFGVLWFWSLRRWTLGPPLPFPFPVCPVKEAHLSVWVCPGLPHKDWPHWELEPRSISPLPLLVLTHYVGIWPWPNEPWESSSKHPDTWVCNTLCNCLSFLLMIIIFKCLLQHVSWQLSINKTALQVFMALESPECGPLSDVIQAWFMEIHKAAV